MHRLIQKSEQIIWAIKKIAVLCPQGVKVWADKYCMHLILYNTIAGGAEPISSIQIAELAGVNIVAC